MLAAGIGRRLHAQKVLTEVGKRTLLQRALDACGNRPVIVVASPLVAPHVVPTSKRTVVVNDAPERGMTHSLRLADEAAPIDAPIAVILADMPFVDRRHVDAIIEQWDDSLDILSPERDGVPAHPAIFGPAARRALAGLPEGDSLRALRGDRSFRRRIIAVEDSDALLDIDSEESLRTARERAKVRER
ncbi:MAG TPA: NTP transferase domain-containing protein [Candidatus Binatia bacterium]|nr:NTP transferase domain-containing protein [Candidatus Binatia bacterium]